MLLIATAVAFATRSSGISWSYFVLWRFVHVQGQNIWNGHFGIVLLSRVFPLCKSSAARCADLTFLAAVCIASLPVGIPTRRFPLCVSTPFQQYCCYRLALVLSTVFSVLHKDVQRNWLSYSWLSLQWYIHSCICSRS